MKKEHALGRVYAVHPNNTECYHLRLLLHEVIGPSSFDDLKTVNGVIHPTFQLPCMALGLLEDDKHWDSALEEAALCESPFKIRELFTIMLVFCQISNPLSLWEEYKDSLSEDYQRQVERLSGNTEQLADEIYNKCLVTIEEPVLALGGQNLQQYGLPQPQRSEGLHNRDYLRETSYSIDSLSQVVSSSEGCLTHEQMDVYKRIFSSIETGVADIFFLDAPGGTGKTFLINLLLAKVRSYRGIALAVASSGVAATLLEGGKTAHSMFKLPLNLIQTETPLCNIPKQSNMAEVLHKTKLIVWDESTMAHKGGFEALNRSLQDIRNNNSQMGGVTVLLAGDFRQTLPVVPRGTRADEFKACVKRSHLWPSVTKLNLTKNLRVHLRGDVSAGQFSDLLLKIGDGDNPEVDNKIILPTELGTIVTTVEELIAKIYPDNSNIQDRPAEWLCKRAILTPKNDQAAIISGRLGADSISL